MSEAKSVIIETETRYEGEYIARAIIRSGNVSMMVQCVDDNAFDYVGVLTSLCANLAKLVEIK